MRPYINIMLEGGAESILDADSVYKEFSRMSNGAQERLPRGMAMALGWNRPGKGTEELSHRVNNRVQNSEASQWEAPLYWSLKSMINVIKTLLTG